MMKATWVLTAGLLTAVFGLAHATADTPTHVHIVGFAYDPTPATVNVGDAVAWDNHDGPTHTVTSDDGTTFDSGNMPTSSTFTYIFTDPGTYTYHCSIHPSMQGSVIVVQPDGAADLVVDVVSVEADVPGIAHTVSVRITNAGNTVAAATTAELRYASAETNGQVGTLSFPTLGPGQSATMETEWATVGLVGEFTITATADALDAVAEEDETNNESSTTTSVLIGGIEGRDLGDL